MELKHTQTSRGTAREPCAAIRNERKSAPDGRKPRLLVIDKGSECTCGDVQALLETEGVDWKRLPQHTPEARGLIERLVLTLKREWLLRKDPQTMLELRRSLGEFTGWYNEEREHESLDWKIAKEIYTIEAIPL